MATGTLKTYGGKILTDGGKLASGDDCCCEEDPVWAEYELIPCLRRGSDHCTDCDANTVPEYFTVTLRNVVNCPETFGYDPEEVNGVPVVMEQHATPCFWTASYGDWNYQIYIEELFDSGEISFTFSAQASVLDGPPDTFRIFWYLQGPAFPSLDCRLLNRTGYNELDEGDCDFPPQFHPIIGHSGTAEIVVGAYDDACPSGAAIYTDTDLSAYVGKVVLIEGVCYAVYNNEDEEVSDGDVTVADSYDDCEDCCDDNPRE